MSEAIAWSRDGKAILAWITNAGSDGATRDVSIAWIAAADGAVRTIKSFDPSRVPGPAQLSFDGGLIAYSAVARAESAERHIYVIDANGQNETDVVKIAGSNTSPSWTPDGGQYCDRNDLHHSCDACHRLEPTARSRLARGAAER